MATHNELGNKGEKLACEYLISKGYTIRNINWKVRKFEIDIIAENKEYIVIVEVKTRSYTYFGEPKEFVNKAKIKRIINAAGHYIYSNNINKEIRFDIISISKTTKEDYNIEHIENAFTAALYY